MPELSNRLQAALGAGYRIERELGGGGMSHVFLAEEVRLGRRVVVKVLPPEMSVGVSVDRFEREIQLAARLQHPHIVPLLSAGSSDDLLYYIMPYIEGESLRAKLAREGELPVPEALRILRDVVDALAFAHGQKVVHRDIKPDNVLLSGKHALVTDFGVAKAVAESTGRQTLTSMGVALGTPLYMAPEQATADPHVDHRADIYALGVLAYEMLCGRPPFTGMTAQAVLASHLTDAPEPVTKHRSAVPDALNAVILRCLEKKAADRWQQVDELLPHLEAMLTPTATPPFQAVGAVAAAGGTDQGHPLRLAGLFALISLGVLAVVYALVQVIGLPDWVLWGAVALLAMGLPIVLATGRQERRRALARTSGQFTAPGALERHFTWRKALLGGALGFGALSLVAAGYMAMRLLGIGPVGTLVAAGVLRERDGIILADFANRTGDSTLGPSVTELFRVGISQSPVINVLDRTRITGILGRMQRPASTSIDRTLALEMAEREGLKAVITGEIVPVGTGFGLTAQVISIKGDVLTAQQASAPSAGEIIGAVDQLSARIRERVGESLRTIRRTAPLEQVTTPSLAALRLYAQGWAAENAGDQERAVDLLQQAVHLDTSFAMAYRKIGTILGNNFEQRERATRAVTLAFEHRDRLTDREAAQAAGMYYTRVTGEREKAIAAYVTLLDRYPDDVTSLNNLGVLYGQLHDADRALEYYQRALARDSALGLLYTNVAWVQMVKGDYDGAARTLSLYDARFPGNPRGLNYRAQLEFSRGDLDSALALLNRIRDTQRGNAFWQASAARDLADISAVRGRLAEARAHWQNALAATAQRGLKGEYLGLEIDAASAEAVIRGDAAAARRALDAALKHTPMEQLPALDRPYFFVILAYVLSGDLPAARRWLDGFRSSGVAEAGRDPAGQYAEMRALVSLVESRSATALAELRRATDENPCMVCGAAVLGMGYDAAGLTDSAIAGWERFVGHHGRVPPVDVTALPTAYRRLGELYEQQGNREKALEYYGRFAELWKDADPDLQPVVRDVKQRMARLAGEGGPR